MPTENAKDYFKRMVPSGCSELKGVGGDGFFNQRVDRPEGKEDETAEKKSDTE